MKPLDEAKEAEIRNRIESDRDYIAIARFDYSLAKLEERYPDGAPPHVIAQALRMDEEEVEAAYKSAILKLRAAMKVDVDEDEGDQDDERDF